MRFSGMGRETGGSKPSDVPNEPSRVNRSGSGEGNKLDGSAKRPPSSIGRTGRPGRRALGPESDGGLHPRTDRSAASPASPTGEIFRITGRPARPGRGAESDRSAPSRLWPENLLITPDKSPEREAHREGYGNRLLKASGDYGTTGPVDSLFAVFTRGWETQSFVETETAGLIDSFSGMLQGAVDTALKGVGAGIGLSAVEATIGAGICTNFILAPITGPLEKAASFIEAAGVAIGIATGPHGLVLACIKPLAHTELQNAISKCFVNLISGPHPGGSESDAQTSAMRNLQRAVESQRGVPQRTGTEALIHQLELLGVIRPVPSDAPVTTRETTRRNTLWLCLGFVPQKERPARSAALAPGIGRTADLLNDLSKVAVLAAGDDEFLRTLPAALQSSSVSEVKPPTVKTRSDLPEGRHFILRVGGAGVSGGTSDPQVAYLHPGCLTGRCVPPNRPRCPCRCAVCRSLRKYLP